MALRVLGRLRFADVADGPSGESPIKRVAVVALGVPPDQASVEVAKLGLTVVVAIAATDRGTLWSIRRRMDQENLDALVAYSSDWSRQAYSAVYEIALTAASRGRAWYLADGSDRSIGLRQSSDCVGAVVNLVIGAIWAAITLIVEGSGGKSRRVADVFRRRRRWPSTSMDPWVVVIWRGGPVTEGGAITHLAGILSGFKDSQIGVALISNYPVPPSCLPYADKVVVTEPLPAWQRITRDLARMAADRQTARTCSRLVGELSARMIYQRHAYQAVAGWRVSDLTGVPLVLEWNASELWAKRNWWQSDPLAALLSRRFERLAALREAEVLKGAAVVAAVSKAAAQMAIDGGADPRRVLVVPNGVDLRRVPHRTRRVERFEPRLGWVGTFGPWHGAEIAIEALRYLPKEISLVLIGDGVARQPCERLSEELAVSDRVQFTGALSHDRVMERLADCNILLSPHVPIADTPFFGSPTKLFEYMALGRPIVASRLEQLGEILEDGVSAVLVDPGSPSALADGIKLVLAMPDRGAHLGLAARAEAERTHTWEVRVHQILEAIKI